MAVTKGELAHGEDSAVIPVMAVASAAALSFTGTSAQSDALDSDGGHQANIVVRLCATQNCYVAFGEDPTATSSSTYLPAGIVEYFRMTAGHKIAALQVSDVGSLSISIMD